MFSFWESGLRSKYDIDDRIQLYILLFVYLNLV